MHFPPDILRTCVRWDVAYSLRDRPAEARMEERGVDVDHATFLRWVVTYSPQLEEVCHERMQNLGYGTHAGSMGHLMLPRRLSDSLSVPGPDRLFRHPINPIPR